MKRSAGGWVEIGRAAAALLLCVALAGAARAGDSGGAWPAVSADTPRNVAELAALQQKVEAVVSQARLCTVAVIIGNSQGSGVIVSRDGYILTAGHVTREPGLDVLIFLSDGRRLHGKTLGVNAGIDSGLIKISETGDWPFVPMGRSADLRTGQWCLALGHPNGYHRDRPAVLRLGRVLLNNLRQIVTDCTLVAGDSGGPLFDLDGRVIGIHSRIGEATFVNVHVPIDTYQLTWKRLAAGEAWGRLPTVHRAVLGLSAEDHARGCRVINVVAGGPAERAGIEVGDIIIYADGKHVDGLDALSDIVGRRQPGDALTLRLMRGAHEKTVTVLLEQRKSD
jgi:serine protease Do